ncbi:MAG: phytase [Polymorphobacter sp.]|uniref:phytase n=1 Tax=Polymorphobacter sp. TaxID=1909290 RepID=UPI003A83703A
MPHRPLLLSLALLAACAPRSSVPPAPTLNVPASGETAPVGTSNADAADDPAIWRNPENPAASLIIGTDKKAGLYVYGLDGKVRDFLDAGRVNNVDLADVDGRLILGASDRNDEANAAVALFALDPDTAKLTALGTVPAGLGEAYGFCFTPGSAPLNGFIVLKDGTINQLVFDLAGPPTARIVRTLKVETQAEGCIVDAASGQLYVAEEDAGIWRFDAATDGATAPTPVAMVDGTRLVDDVEGLAVADGYLIASSQGDNAYAVYRLADHRYMGRFRISPGRYGATQETDGIEVIAGDFGPDYPQGLMVAQDGENPPFAQNFKLVSWAAIKQALKLD